MALQKNAPGFDDIQYSTFAPHEEDLIYAFLGDIYMVLKIELNKANLNCKKAK